MADNKRIHVIGGGTVSHVRGHLALCAPAYGGTARRLHELATEKFANMDVVLNLSKLAVGGEAPGSFETNEDLATLLDALVANPATKVIFMNAAVCDFDGSFSEEIWRGPSGKHEPRISTQGGVRAMTLTPAEKLIPRLRATRKDIFVVAFKETTGATEDEQYIAALNLCKEASVNLVVANDIVTRRNIIVTPEEARYCSGEERDEVLKQVVDMAWNRSHLTFTRSRVVEGEAVPWDSPEVPDTLRGVVNYCIAQGAYKPFRGVTTGHFACKVNETTFLTSIRKTDFNQLAQNGLVRVKTDGPDSVIAYGSKPSVGGQSQRIVFHNHADYDCIVHFHCPLKEGSEVPVASQREYECGSHECGRNTSNHLQRFGNLSAVYLDNHGPNLVFNRNIDPQEVIEFIEANFDLSQKTGGYVTLGQILDTPNRVSDLADVKPYLSPTYQGRLSVRK